MERAIVTVIEHGGLSARRVRAICNALRHNATITSLQRLQDARNEEFWIFSSQPQIMELILSGLLTPALMCKNAVERLIDRDLELAVLALDDRSLLAAAGDLPRLQALFDRAVEPVDWIWQAGSFRSTRIARVLLSRYPAINPFFNGSSAFFCACWAGDLALVQMLLVHERVRPSEPGTGAANTADVDNGLTDDIEETPLHFAASAGQTEVAAFLLANGSNVNAIDSNGSTPLHRVAEWCRLEMAVLLLAYGASVTAADCRRCTPLHVAAEWGHKEVVEVLLANGADADAFDNDNWTPLRCAAEKNNVDVVEVRWSTARTVTKCKLAQSTMLIWTPRAGLHKLIWCR